MLRFVTDTPKVLRLDPAPSRVFTFLEWTEDAPAVIDDRGRTIQPAGSVLLVHFRGSGIEWSHWPVSEEEARAVMFPNAVYDFSIGRAYSSIIKAHKSGRPVKSADRQETKKQREQQETRAGRRWLA